MKAENEIQTSSMLAHLIPSLLMTFWTVVLLGFVYPQVVTGLAHVFFREQADGSLIYDRNGAVIGSALSGQRFTDAKYFHARPSAAGNGYDPLQSGGTNLGPTSKKLIDATRIAVASTTRENMQASPPPSDLVSSSASGLDPDISPQSAAYQRDRVAAARRMKPELVQMLIVEHTTDRDLAIFGEPRVNVLALNLALDQQENR